MAHEDIPALGATAFEILPSLTAGPTEAQVTPDTATCEACLRELLDPGDRRHRYPFINCTDCGPRFTIVRGVPYDRPNTTMAEFRMCPDCRREYDDPADRRFHAQPNACPACGPSVALLDGDGARVDTQDAVRTAGEALRRGRILAVKGLGGYHLACRADDESSVAALRARKHREDKPFALMARDLATAHELIEIGAGAAELLTSPQRPIVLAPRRLHAPVAPSVAPRATELGVMLPYSPLHHLLLADAGTTLVMTSGNVSDEPIAFRDEEALVRLRGIADLLLVHDRPIETRTDDSVIRARGPLFLRRSRGYVPSCLPAPAAPRPILACGAELKSTFCLTKDARAWVSHHIGDLENYETLRSFTEGIEHFKALSQVEPEIVAHDLHPEYLSTKYALEQPSVELMAVQHHHAHLAAVLAEYERSRPAIAAIFDGTGYGTDGTVWGGEFLHGDLHAFERVGSLLAVRMPGGAQAIRQPWRMAAAWLAAATGGDEPPPPRALAGRVAPRAWRQVLELARTGVASPQTTSVGRLFDAVAALCGVRTAINYEGQAAVELEACCDPHERGEYPIASTGGVIDPREAIRMIAAERDGPATAAARFHNGLARATVAACADAAAVGGTDAVILSGGVFANQRLLDAVARGLDAAGLEVLVPRRLPVNDGAISYGQAAVAAARMAT